MPSSHDTPNTLIAILRDQIIPCWEYYGAKRLAVTALTKNAFERQSPPEFVRTSIKKRKGRKVTSHRRGFGNSSPFAQSWPEDDQAIFRYPALIFVAAGQADFHIADYIIHCPSGHFLFFRNGVPRPIGAHPHLEGNASSQRENAVLWFFAPPGTNSIVAYICHSTPQKHWSDEYHIVHRPEVLHLYKTLVREIEENGAFIDLCFQPFLHFYLRELLHNNFHRVGSINTSPVPAKSSSPIADAKQYIKTHLNRPLLAEDVARQIYMSRNNFLRHWKQETEQSFHEFVTEQRMKAAKQLLQNGRWSINFICRSVGLRPTQFRAQFHKSTGMNPSVFRAQLTDEKSPNKLVQNQHRITETDVI